MLFAGLRRVRAGQSGSMQSRRMWLCMRLCTRMHRCRVQGAVIGVVNSQCKFPV